MTERQYRRYLYLSEKVRSEGIPVVADPQKNQSEIGTRVFASISQAQETSRSGEKWTAEEENVLLGEWLNQTPIAEIALSHRRTIVAISSRFWAISGPTAKFVKNRLDEAAKRQSAAI
ncbi:MAG: hypothetical protein V4819_03885 [Verrucomicrobiota bacterium]